MRYIDVSQWQGAIDWDAVRGSIDGAILRAGCGAGHPDGQFARSAAACNRLGIPCGAYWFSYAWTPEMAAAEAKALLAAVKPYRMELPLCFDFEYDSVRVAAREGGVTVDKALATAMVRAFCETVEAGGYYALFYANPDFLGRYFEADLPRRFGLWLAQWPGGAPDPARPPRPCAMWQWTATGAVPGIAGDVDVSEAYSDFAELIRAAGINGLGAGEDADCRGDPMWSPAGASTAGEPGDHAGSPLREDTGPAAPLASPSGGGAPTAAPVGRDDPGAPQPAPVGRPWPDPAAPLASPSGGGAPAGGGEGPFADALAWARAAGILPDGLAPTDTPTLAAVAEMFYLLCRREGETDFRLAAFAVPGPAPGRPDANGAAAEIAPRLHLPQAAAGPQFRAGARTGSE